MKILPELLKSVEFGGGGPKALTAVVKIGTKLTDEEYSSRLTPVIVRLFANPDRAIRVSLLDNLPLMIDRLPQKLVTDKIFPQMVSTVHYKFWIKMLIFLDFWIYGCCTRCSRTNCQGSFDGYWKVV